MSGAGRGAARVSLIAAVAENGVIGAAGGMPWRLSSDLKRFKQLTLGKPVVMGRKTFETIGKPLPGRDNIVVTRQGGFAPAGVIVVASLDAALEKAATLGAEEVMVAGGGEIYAQAMERADRLYITHVEAAPLGDVRFPLIDKTVWHAGPEIRVPEGEKDSAASRFVIYERRRDASSG